MSSSWPERLRRTLGFRLAAWYAALFLLGSAAAGTLAYAMLARSLAERDADIVLRQSLEYAGLYTRGGLAALSQGVAAAQAAGRNEPLFVRVLTRFESATFLQMPPGWGPFDLDRLELPDRPGEPAWGVAPARGSQDALEVASLMLADGTLLQVGKSRRPRGELLARFRKVLGAATAAVLLIALVGGVVLTRSALQPVRDLAATVRRVLDEGRLEARVPRRQPGDPLDALSELINHMLARIEALVAGMRGALDNVAHDLRTPLARLRATAESGLAPGTDAAALRDALADCLEESERIHSMLEQLMDISEAETGTLALRVEPVDLQQLVAETAELFADVAEDKQVGLVAATGPPLPLHADRGRLRQLLANLLDNAVKYTPAGGRVFIAAHLAGDWRVVEVRDTGRGIPANELPRIWERLYRGDESRSERGLGLGLSLVRAVALAHGGQAEAESQLGQGSCFRVRLPANPPSSAVSAHLSPL